MKNTDGNVSGQGNGPDDGGGNGQKGAEGSGTGSGWSAILSDPPKALLAIAAAVLVLGVGYGVCYYGGAIDLLGWSGWGIASATFYISGYAVFSPAVVLGLVALLLERSDERRGEAARMIRLVNIAAVLVALAGLAGVVSLVGQALWGESNWPSGWYVASTGFSMLAGALFDCGVLLGLVYIFRQLERKHAARLSPGQDMPDVAPPAAEGGQG